MEKFDEAAAKALETLDAFAKMHGQEIAETAISAIALRGIGGLMHGFAFLFVTLLCVWVGYVCSVWARKHNEEWYVGCLVSGGVFVFMFVGTIVNLVNVYNWVAVFNPKLYAASRIMNRLF